MKIYIGADHQGHHLKEALTAYLKSAGYEVIDEGNERFDPEDDFPQFAQRTVAAMLGSNDQDPRGILICGGGQGMAMAANRFRGIRASVIWDREEARLTRNDNDSNVLCLPSRILDSKEANLIVETWLHTPFAAAPRYKRRNRELDELM